MQYPDLVWTALAAIGGFLLLPKENELTKYNWAGIWMIFIAYLFQVYWELATNPKGGNLLGVNENIVGVTIILLIDGLLLVWPGWFRKWVAKKKAARNSQPK